MKVRAAVAHEAGTPLVIETVDLDGPRAGEVGRWSGGAHLALDAETLGLEPALLIGLGHDESPLDLQPWQLLVALVPIAIVAMTRNITDRAPPKRCPRGSMSRTGMGRVMERFSWEVRVE
jgi:hypothetical protein